MGIILLFASQAGAPDLKAGYLSPAGRLSGTDATTHARTGTLAADTSVSGARNVPGGVPATLTKPSVVYEVAFTSPPLTVSPTWTNLSARLRDAGGLNTTRGRSYEFNRNEAGTARAVLNNRDAALSPANTSSPYNPLKSTRPVRARLQYDQTYPLFYGISEGYPQAYPHLGKDALVELQASDLFYALNQSKFTPGSTTLTTALIPPAIDLTEPVTVTSTALPMPQAVPFEITIDDEVMTVTQIVSATSYLASRTVDGSSDHAVGAAVTTQAVSFGEELSGDRIGNVLDAVGFTAQWQDLDTGQSVMAASEDLSSINPLEHINLIAEAEFGRFFVSRSGVFTFRDRHSIILDFLTPSMTFRNLPATGTNVPFRIEGALEHSEDKLFNRVRITIPSGEVVDINDPSSITDHFERIFDRSWPYASVNDAEAAAYFILNRSVAHTLRLPRISVRAQSRPSLWPTILARELGDRATFYYQPEGGGTAINQEVIVEGISHDISADEHVVNFQLTEADPNDYWILGLAGYGELEQTTWVGF